MSLLAIWTRGYHADVRLGGKSLANLLTSTALMLSAAMWCPGTACADPSQQDQFLALLEQEQIPPTGAGEVPGVVARAHQICAALNSGSPMDTLVTAETDRAYADNPALHLYADRVTRTAIRFITASVNIYCPSHRAELPPYA
ncbi:DUF732 domain-containing protein [Mycobacterium paraterrae]|uniref:DUF732 domain-containing protein n=1 Tax=Mycobacterium paraterrae TaxID=577492 RepID=A0ABY3VSZ6_9MYCO|nr:DUF732 domain-containing protein [Mycobacterium paraterrae]UMB71760.1 DUF732 domain-containing protein [Mycobacterium paraterrae]